MVFQSLHAPNPTGEMQWVEPSQCHNICEGYLVHVLQLLPIGCTQQNLCWVSKSMMKYQQKNGLKI